MCTFRSLTLVLLHLMWRNLQGFETVKFLLVSLDRGWILVQRSDEVRKIQSREGQNLLNQRYILSLW